MTLSYTNSISDILNRGTGGNSGTPEVIFWEKTLRGAPSANTVRCRPNSMWLVRGAPGHGAAPGAVAAPTNATAGALQQTSPGGGRTKYLISWICHDPIGVAEFILYDRLLHISGLSGTNTSAQTVGGSITRYTGTESVGNRIFIEIYTQIGASSTSITASYTDQDNNSGITSQTTPIGNTNLREVQRLIEIPLAAGDTGVRAVASVDLLATTGTAGDFGVNIMRPLAKIITSDYGGNMGRDFLSGNPIGDTPLPIGDDACLFLARSASSNTWTHSMHEFVFIEG